MYQGKLLKKILCIFIAALFCLCGLQVSAEDLNISAKACILIEAETGRVLYHSNENERLPMASTTKIMSALLALEQPELDTPFTVDNNAIMVEGSSMGLRPDDTVTLRDLCYGMLLPSGNDAANLAAVRVAGSAEAFAELMNERAAEIGMTNTNFVTPSGLHNEEHYSTAYDMALLAREALKNPDFAEICQQGKAKLCFGNPPYNRWLSNHNKLLSYYEGCIGLKTGFTKKAGRCLVSAAERNGVKLICVTLNAPNDWQDHTKMLDYGFSILQQTELTPDLTGVSVGLVGGTVDSIGVTAQPATAMLTAEEQGRVEQQILLRPFCYAPVKAGDQVGSYRYLLDGREVASGILTAAEDGAQSTAPVTYGLWDRIKNYVRLMFG